MNAMAKKKQDPPPKEYSTVRAVMATKNKVAKFVVGTGWDITSFYDEAVLEKLKKEQAK